MLHRFLQDVCFFSEEAASPEDIWPLFICQYLFPSPCLSWPYDPAFRLLLTSLIILAANSIRLEKSGGWVLTLPVMCREEENIFWACIKSSFFWVPFLLPTFVEGIISADILGFMFLSFCSSLSLSEKWCVGGNLTWWYVNVQMNQRYVNRLILFVAWNLLPTVSVLWFSSLLVVPFLEFAVAFYTARVHQRVLNTPNNHQFIMVATKKKRKERCNS